jgi:surfactin synthase thioesterase subunit
MTAQPNGWIARISPSARARIRLLCIPNAGGGTTTFRPLAGALPEQVELCAVRLPGRETRRREPSIRRMDEVVDALTGAMDDLKELPWALFGYCSGAITAFELAHHLRRTGRPAPAHLFACTAAGPRRTDRGRGVHGMSRADLVNYLRQFRVTPESILTEPSLFSIFEPGIRADFEAIETTTYQPEPPLDLPITVFGARDDTGVPFDELLEWREHTASEFALRMFPGGHTFFSGDTGPLGRVLAADLLTTEAH